MFDTIVAISAGGQINQAISIIRVSGPDAFAIVKKVFDGKVGKDKEITYGLIKDNDLLIDEVLVMWFQGTNNFIGEDTVEINAHGGIVNTNLILELLLANGCRLAEPGEFSRRAFLNGKMDLVKAEAINDLIHAKTKTQALKSVQKFNNKTSKLINQLILKLEILIGHCETNIDYPEMEDLEQLTNETLLPILNDLIKAMAAIVKESENARVLFEGISVAIVGKPNVGKSSLLNALLEEDKAIVTDIAGTTRDIVEGQWQINGILFKLKDTAGIRKSQDVVEQIGIDKALQEIANANLVIHVVDATKPWDHYDQEILDHSKDKQYFKVFNKEDLLKTKEKKEGIYISALNNQIETLEKAIIKQYQNVLALDDDKILNNIRQLALIKSAKKALCEAIAGLGNGFGPEVVIIDIRQAWEDLYNIIGKASNEILLDSMFSHFCLGK